MTVDFTDKQPTAEGKILSVLNHILVLQLPTIGCSSYRSIGWNMIGVLIGQVILNYILWIRFLTRRRILDANRTRRPSSLPSRMSSLARMLPSCHVSDPNTVCSLVCSSSHRSTLHHTQKWRHTNLILVGNFRYSPIFWRHFQEWRILYRLSIKKTFPLWP